MRYLLILGTGLFLLLRKNNINYLDVFDDWEPPTYDSVSELIDGNWFYSEYNKSP